MNDKVLEVMYEQQKLNLTPWYLLWIIWFHYAHVKKWWLQIIFMISLFFAIGILWWFLQGLVVRTNINKYNDELKLKMGLQN